MFISDMITMMNTATGTAPATVHKHYRLDQGKITRAQQLLGTRNETETIERALQEVIMNREKNIRLWEANERFLNSGIVVEDVFGNLE